ncbi:tryptophan-tRNA ligase [Trichophyton interdigitale MR816]|uniref:Tryptophan--tRNA ligase, mitochondrial n=1 Tax=Trichophyton interdigitale (strain MR816) TaxID=1215338 RepID=A0A059JEQ7_TRIIM|nr:tryptophan-tRNA ligase [Trichophyton interdigitale H6]KDB26264.1 tryptophan-tRNA ligase [Trichophyton interdigitale MR816]
MFTPASQKYLLRCCRRYIPSKYSISAKYNRQWLRYSSTTTEPAPPKETVVFSGIQPTGIPHLGNYLGALRSWVDLQNTSSPDTKLIYSIVDLHALTLPKPAEDLRRWRKEALAVLLAIGIKPERATLFYQSDVPAHSELMWILSVNASTGYLSRMTQWKSKLNLPENAKFDLAARNRLKLGLFSYPVLQAADVLVHRANYIPVGEDQKQHIEFAREVANGFNHLHGPVLTVPEAMISPAKRVMSLKNPKQKMSKSDADIRSRILITDTPMEIHHKIRLALTDAGSTIAYDPEKRPGVSNLLEMFSHAEALTSGPPGTTGRSPTEIALEYENSSFKALKQDLSSKLIEMLGSIRERYVEIMEEDAKVASSGSSDKESYLGMVARRGAEEASANAAITMRQVRTAIGLS